MIGLAAAWLLVYTAQSPRPEYSLSATDFFQLCSLNAVPGCSTLPFLLQYSLSPRGPSSCSLVVLTLGSPGSVIPLHTPHSFLMEGIFFLLLFYATFPVLEIQH